MFEYVILSLPATAAQKTSLANTELVKKVQVKAI